MFVARSAGVLTAMDRWETHAPASYDGDEAGEVVRPLVESRGRAVELSREVSDGSTAGGAAYGAAGGVEGLAARVEDAEVVLWWWMRIDGLPRTS